MLPAFAALADHGAGRHLSEADFLDELPVVLSVSRLSQPVNETPAAVTVIDHETIRASGFRDIPDVLRLVPGFSVAYTRDNSWAVAYHGVADGFSRRFQVLVDGRSIYNAAYGAVPWAELPLSIEDIERIEVVRGPNAASFGSNAFFAVINIITRHASQTPGGTASLQLGEHGMAGLTLRHGGGNDAAHWRLSFSAQDRDRFETNTFDRDRPEKLFEATRTFFISGRADVQITANAALSAQFGWTEGRWDAGRARDPLEPREQDVRSQFVQIKYTLTHNTDDESSWQFYHSRNLLDAPNLLGIPLGGGQVVVDAGIDVMQARTNLEFVANRRLNDTLRLAWGAEIRRDTVESMRYFDTSSTLSGNLARAHANLEWRVHPDWLLHGGAMVEHHHYAGTDISPRLAFNYTLADGHTLRAGVSQAYRTPTFFEQDGQLIFRLTDGTPLPDGAAFVPATNALAPERIISRELGYVAQSRARHWQFDARVFSDTVTRYIDTVSAASNNRRPFRYTNQGDFSLRGGELQLAWQPAAALHVNLSYARVFIDADADVNDDVPRSAPVNSGSVLARYQFGDGWQTSVGLYHSGAMQWLGDGDVNPAYTRVDLRLARVGTWQGVEWEAALVGQNLGSEYSEFRLDNRVIQRIYASLVLHW